MPATSNPLLAELHHHVSGAIARGEAAAIVGVTRNHIRFNTGTGGYTVFLTDDSTHPTHDIVEAVALADPEGTGIVQCDAIVERHLARFCDADAIALEVGRATLTVR